VSALWGRKYAGAKRTAEKEESERRVNGKDSHDAAGRGLETRRCSARRKRNLGGKQRVRGEFLNSRLALSDCASSSNKFALIYIKIYNCFAINCYNINIFTVNVCMYVCK